jgi:hypothetical protein
LFRRKGRSFCSTEKGKENGEELKEMNSFYSELVLLNYDAAGPKNFTLTCPFVPSKVTVRMTVSSPSAAGTSINPLTSNNDYRNVFIANLTCFPPNFYLLQNALNGLSQVWTFDNIANRGFNGTFSCTSKEAKFFPNGGDQTGGQLIFSFTYQN